MRNPVTLSHVRQPLYIYDLLRALVVRDMKLRYKRSILGVAWSLLNPLIQMLVFVLLFRRVLQLDIPNYPSFVFTGVLAWSWFQSALSLAAGAITGNRELIRRPGFPAAILPVVTMTAKRKCQPRPGGARQPRTPSRTRPRARSYGSTRTVLVR